MRRTPGVYLTWRFAPQDRIFYLIDNLLKIGSLFYWFINFCFLDFLFFCLFSGRDIEFFKPSCYSPYKMKKMVKTRNYKFVAIIKPAEEGGYYAYSPLLSGCAAQGETYAEVVVNIEDAIKGMVEVMIENGDPLPVEAIGENYILDIPVQLPQRARFC